MPGRDQLETFEIITAAETFKRLVDTGQTYAIGDVDYAGEFFERVEECLRDIARLRDKTRRKGAHIDWGGETQKGNK